MLLTASREKYGLMSALLTSHSWPSTVPTPLSAKGMVARLLRRRGATPKSFQTGEANMAFMFSGSVVWMNLVPSKW